MNAEEDEEEECMNEDEREEDDISSCSGILYNAAVVYTQVS